MTMELSPCFSKISPRDWWIVASLRSLSTSRRTVHIELGNCFPLQAL